MQQDRANAARAKESLRLVYDNSPDAILLLDSILHHMGEAVIVADKRYRFQIFNAAAERRPTRRGKTPWLLAARSEPAVHAQRTDLSSLRKVRSIEKLQPEDVGDAWRIVRSARPRL